MSTIKVTDFVFGRLQAPDLDREEEFLSDFGMVRAERTKNALYMRGTGPSPYLHVTELGPEPRYLGAAFSAGSEEDLRKIAGLEEAVSGVEALDAPGGGKRVRIRDPRGHIVEIVHGIQPADPLPVRRVELNDGSIRRRLGERFRQKHGPSQVKRIGHVVLVGPNVPGVVKWYRERLGLLASDDIYEGENPANLTASFSRLDRGDEYVDHHVLFIARAEKPGLNHFSFEVEDWDDLMFGHEYLEAKQYEHVWGIGRHGPGSQVYDYWKDPWGRIHEHWTDTDLLNARNEVVLTERSMIRAGSPWGPNPPEWFPNYGTP
ncbi:MAG TPA: VOC family protein [Candidatus Binataceae bacterium]|nr:VOC family protein [Candidatus Binataceae bacterium]